MTIFKECVKLPLGEEGHAIGQIYVHRGRTCIVRFVRRLTPVPSACFYEELELETVEEAA